MTNPPEENRVNDELVVGLLDAIWSVAEGSRWFLLSKHQMLAENTNVLSRKRLPTRRARKWFLLRMAPNMPREMLILGE
jgi:hypothetical protein